MKINFEGITKCKSVVCPLLLLTFLSTITIAAEVDALEKNTVIELQREYSFIRPQSKYNQWPVLFVDMLYLLNHSQRDISKGTLPVSESQAIEAGLNELVKKYSFIKNSDLLDVELERLNIQTPDNIWYYKVTFDAKSSEPFSLEGKKTMDLYYAIVLMDGSAWTMQPMSWEEHTDRFSIQCKYNKNITEWVRYECVPWGKIIKKAE